MKNCLYFKLGTSCIAFAMLLSGCKSTFQERRVEPCGFLQNTQQLWEGNKEQAKLIYIDKNVDYNKYTKILMAPVKGYGTGKKGSVTKLKVEDQKKLLNYFDAALRRELSTSYTFVDKPGQDVIKLRVAVTEAKGSKIALDTVSSVVPIGLALSSVNSLITGKHMSIGKIGVEFEALDSNSNKRLAAAIDARAGRKYTLKFDKFKKWRTAEDAFDYWAKHIHQRMNDLKKNK